MMRAPTPSEPKSNTFPTYQVPQESAMRGRAPHPVQHEVARASRGGRADPPTRPFDVLSQDVAPSVITGSGCCPVQNEGSNLNLKLQSVTENCLLNSVTVPKIQRNDRYTVSHNNLNNNNVDSYKLDDSSKFGALPFGRDIPNQKSDDLEVLDDLNALKTLTITAVNCDNNDKDKECTDGDYDLCHKLMQKLRTTFDDRQGFFAPLRLRGGGESSLSTGTSGWGTPPTQQASNNNMNNTSGWGATNPSNQNNAGTQQWNNNANRPPASSHSDANKTNANGQQPPTSQSNSSGWGQPGSKPPAGTNGPPTTTASSNNNSQNNAQNVTTNATNTTKQQLEQLNNMREAIFSTDGWGGQHVNQDTHWDIPSSPEPAMKLDGTGPPPWKPPVNNGTELWEANLRNGGQPPPQPQQKTPWGHTPSTNIGGTWGEDDDAADSSNVWTGVPNNQQQQQQQQQQQWGGNNNNSNAMWGDSSKRVAGAAGANASGWGDPRAAPDPRAAAAAAAAAMEGMRPDLRAAAAASGLDPRQLDPREQMRQIAGGDMRGDPRGITGRLNGAGAEFWGQTGPHAGPTGMHHQNKMPVGPGNTAGWEEPSPPSQRRNMPNYDDGTSLWGNPQQGFHWKDIPTGAGGMVGGRGGPPGMAPGRKPEGVWGGGGGGGGGNRNGWDEVSGGPAGGWGDEPAAPWAKQKVQGGLWDTSDLEWGHKPQNKPPLTKEQVWNSKQFRMLVDMGHKKEDVENALRMREMNMEEALDLLSPLRGRTNDGWGATGRHDDHFDHNQFPVAQRGGYPGIGGPVANPLGTGGFPPGGGAAPGLMNSMTGPGGQANSSLMNNISPAVVQKLLTQQGGAGGVNAQGFVGPNGGRPMQPQTQPSTQQLRLLVQQIQMAVQAGYLNHQILNQPLAPQTLVLLNQLLQQIKTLQQLNNQHQIAAASSKGNLTNQTLMQYSVLITKTKQQIMNIQNQIQAQQAHYVKQQQQGGIGYDSFKTNPMHDSINALQSNFADLALNKDPNQQQSRLNQWINKDKDEINDFSRAPGSSSKPVATSPNMAPLGLTQPDGPWSSGRSADTGWPDSSGGDSSNDVKDAQWATTAQPSLTDLVPEFEPGKPWKGNQIKSIEDDPSITPGSVVRSPLSIATINVKDNELFSINSSKSPPATDAMQSLSSSTWSFNPPSTSSAFTSSPQSKLPSKGGLGDLNPGTAVTSELWGAPKARGPPPGLSGKGGGGGGGSLANGWSAQLGGGSAPWGGAAGAGQRNSGNWGVTPGASQWLLLRNLTAQIDGSTLRTLCMQHGPLLSFHLHLHQGFALAKYSSREEATKAQTALNNCVLGNTTILAESPTDWDANALLQSIANQQGGSSGGWRNSSSKPGGDTWSTGWPNNPSSLWASTPLDSSDPARATPSSLNSFLPNDLLGGESM